jgi:hypothetical protein
VRVVTACRHQEATAIHAVPAVRTERGFRLLVLREFRAADAPPAFALIGQEILRSPERRNRHGVSFALAFRPDIMDWLIATLGRPSQREGNGDAQRNPRWPKFAWHCEDRTWPDGIATIEWYADVAFQDDAAWSAFAAHWSARLDGISEGGEP